MAIEPFEDKMAFALDRGTNPLRARSMVRTLLERPLLSPADLIAPFLVLAREGRAVSSAQPLPTWTLSDLNVELRRVCELGIRGVKLFAKAESRDHRATGATMRGSLMMEAIRLIKADEPRLCVIVETCLCPYTETGECVLRNANGSIDTQGTLEVLSEMAVLQAEAGADVLGPAGMVDGSVVAVRNAMREHGHTDVVIMPHVIFDSLLYTGYRSVMGSAPRLGHRRDFHVSPFQPAQVLDQALRFLDEGADMLLLEPGLPVADVVFQLRAHCRCPIAAFSVSGEYLLLRRGLDEATYLPLSYELLSGLKRAGADLIVTYAARELAEWIADLGYSRPRGE